MQYKHLLIKGRVQGVFFRATMRKKALELGVHGWVKNKSDGTVEAHLEGNEDAVMKLIKWCREGADGTEGAEVANVDVAECDSEECETFEVLR